MRVIAVNSCGNCPYLSCEGSVTEDIYYCEREGGRDLPGDADEIPEWCPLPEMSPHLYELNCVLKNKDGKMTNLRGEYLNV